MNFKNYEGFIICIIFSFGVALPIFIVSLISYLDTIDYQPTLCNITNVEYPTEMPTEETLYLWNRCSCGKRCLSRYPCIKLYSDINKNSIIRDSHGSKTECTITQDSCPRSEDPIVVRETMIHSINVAQSYENSTITCFVNVKDPQGNPIYLHQKDFYVQFIVSVTIFGILFLIICVFIFYNLFDCEKKLLERNYNKKNKEVDNKKDKPFEIGSICNPVYMA